MYKSSLYFTFNGENSIDYGVINCSVESGLYEEQFLPSTEIITTNIRDRDEPYFQTKKLSPRVLDVTLAFEDDITSDKLRALGRLFNQDYYCPMIFSDDLDKIYYVIYQGDPSLFHTGINGYVKFQLLCKSPYIYTREYLSEVYDLSNNSIDGTNIVFTNNGDVICRPEILVQMVGDGGFSICNLTNSGQTLEFVNLSNDEELYTDCDNEDILSSISGVYRYSNHNDVFLEILRGVNNLNVKGNIILQFRYYLKLLC